MTELYKPSSSYTLSEGPNLQQIRLAIQGTYGTGKSTAALTFPNPAVLDFDRGLINHTHRKDVVVLPFYDGAFCDKIRKRASPNHIPDRKNSFIDFMRGEALKFTQDQTLITDSYRQVEIGFHCQYNYEKIPGTNGKYSGFEEWTQKIHYFQEIGTYSKDLKCNYIAIIPEIVDRNDEGKIAGIKPAVSGQSGDTLGHDFTDYYRALTIAKPKTEHRQMFMTQWGIDEKTLVEWIASTKTETIYLWQTQSDATVKCKTSLDGAPKFIVAGYSSFNKYKRKEQTT